MDRKGMWFLSSISRKQINTMAEPVVIVEGVHGTPLAVLMTYQQYLDMQAPKPPKDHGEQ